MFDIFQKEPTMEKRDFKFDKRADKYDDHFEGKLSKVFYKLIYDNIQLTPSAEVLDVGCGTGTILRTLSDRGNISTHGIDVEPEMLKIARSKCPDADIRQCSCEDTPYTDNRFDVLTACMAYHHFSDKEAFEKEAQRILKPDGLLYIADPNFPKIIRKVINRLARRYNGEFFSSDEISERFSRSGFSTVSIQKRKYGQLIILKKT